MSSTTPTSILVLGAGSLGTSVLQALASHSQKHGSITLLLRQSSITSTEPTKRAQLSSLTALGVKTLPGDIALGTVSALADLFAPYHTVVSCAGMAYPASTQLKIARAVLAACVKRFLPWQFGLDYDAIGRGSSQDLFTEQLDVRDLLRQQSETEWVIVSTGLFMEFLFESDFGVVMRSANQVDADGQGLRVRCLGNWENRVTVTTEGDIGRVVAEIVWAATGVAGVVYTAGETVTYRQVAEIVEQVSGIEVKRVEGSVETLKKELAEEPDNGMRKYRVVFAEGRGVAWEEEMTFNAERGIRLQGVEEWLRKNWK
ncbi:hypothetical protein MMC20_008095 [Loxospora ochrophaea]|nr:hypothetical protein [Loxospora ochrophaea]